MPRTYFPYGVTGRTKLAGHKMNGVILVLLILCKMKESHKLKVFYRGSSLWLDKLIRKHVGMEVVAKITVCSTQQDPGISVLHAQAP
jgi:hypothetical protein